MMAGLNHVGGVFSVGAARKVHRIDAQRVIAPMPDDPAFRRSDASEHPQTDSMRALADPRAYTQFKGKRMHYDRTRISVPLGYSWRLMFTDVDGRLRFDGCLSHEDYNRTHPKG